ncbi:hypothetical protein [Bosea rubneri]|uniref:Uncharacterized protein n=1 Tax=Bosea rubneri TaxID=3075434 RepID=A0ABU3SEF5_9HYPH|nr:hypothetical protein [Bosea sp. ZW T0_25]MDU0343180.1 hypothetical protein [Bosea sp. ZW T0_25]
MKLRDITDALVGEDQAMMRQAFGALVAGQEAVEAASPGMLVVALNRLCAALQKDDGVMPEAVAQFLGLPAGSSFAAGAARVKADWTRMSRTIVERV